ncbi:MAG: 5'-deoxynucleotidase [Clostridiales bacterium]|nr:5'-deoxynucleotidase [Clostridiales bacterium]
MKYDFFAYLNRLKHIKRWALMHSLDSENVLEHTAQVSIIAHALAEIKNAYFGGKVDVLKVLLYSQYHETSEVITGDMPTPIKYMNKEINKAYKDIEKGASLKLLETLPPELYSIYEPYVLPDENSEEYIIMKCADKISAYIKCVEELKSGNTEFKKAKDTILKDINKISREEVKFFMKHVSPRFNCSLDELE